MVIRLCCLLVVRAHARAACDFRIRCSRVCLDKNEGRYGTRPAGSGERRRCAIDRFPSSASGASPPSGASRTTGDASREATVDPEWESAHPILRDRQKRIRQVALQDVHNPANTAVIAQYKRNAWLVVSPNDEWIVLNSRDGSESGAQLYHRTSNSPLKYEVPEKLRLVTGAGYTMRSGRVILAPPNKPADTNRGRVTIDGIAWEPDSHKISLSVAPIPAKDDPALPEPWTCNYDVTTKQIVLATTCGGRPSRKNPRAAPLTNRTRPRRQRTKPKAAAPAEESTEFEGEKFPATREEPITVADANELELSDIRYAINEMLARHGATFHDASVKKTFSAFSWYQPRTDISSDEIEKSEFSDVEKHNIAALRRARDAKVAATHRPQPHAIRGEPVHEESEGERAMRNLLQGVSDAVNGSHP